MPAGMKPLEKFLKKQGTALTRHGAGLGLVEKSGSGAAALGGGGAKRRASLSRVVPFFRETSPDSSQQRELFSPDTEDPPSWPSVAPPPAPPPSANGPAPSPTPSPAPPPDVRSPSLSSDEQSSEEPISSSSSDRPGPALHMDTPTNLTLAVLDHVTRQRHAPATETLVDDFMLTHPIFLTSDRFQQLLLQQFRLCESERPLEEEAVVLKKRSVLSLVFRYLDTYRELLQEEGDRGHGFPKVPGIMGNVPLPQGPGIMGNVPLLPQEPGIMGNVPLPQGPGIMGNVPLPQGPGIMGNVPLLPQGPGIMGNVPLLPQELYLSAVQDLSRFPELVEDVLKLQRWTEILQNPCEEEKESRKRQVRPLFRHFRRIDACLQPREAFRGSDEIFCRVYTPDHSYVTIRSRLSCKVGEILALVREKLQYSEDQPVLPGLLVLVAVSSAGDKVVFRPSDEAVFTTLGVNTHLFTCEPRELETLMPLPEEIHWSPGDSKLHDMSAEEVSNQLVTFDWELFTCVHEVEFVCYVFHGEQSRWRPLNLELVLQRCSEVQSWVCTEVLQCQSLPKRVQLLRKFIKIAALCKQQQDLLSFLAVVLGLDNPALSRLRLTWEGLPGKFRKQFQQFESLADPSRNHKSYRDLLQTLRPPLIPFTPLLLKDLTFLHESCKTFHGDLVNFEKMHKVAEMVRTIRRYRSSQLPVDTETSPSHLQTKAYVRQLQVIDNQNLLFEMSCKLEPKDA